LFSAVIKKLAPLRQRPWGVMNAVAKALSLPADVAVYFAEEMHAVAVL
jgi:hypothetical protein